MIRKDSNNNHSSATVLISGGMDSYVCAHMLLSQGVDVRGLFIDYGQAALESEQCAVEKITKFLNIPLYQIKAKPIENFSIGELTGRNAFFIMAALFLGRVNRGLIALGIHAGTPYYDCSQTFINEMKKIVEEHTDGRASVATPLINWNKARVYQYLVDANLPIEETYSCESGTTLPCGKCLSCLDRRELGC